MQIRRYIKYCLFIIICIMVLPSHAQENDFQTWGDIAAKYKINKKFRLNAELGIRTRENSQLLKQQYAEIGLKYRIKKRINAGIKYRYSNYSILHKTSSQRLNLDLEYSFKKWGRTRLTIRERYQYEWLVFRNITNYDEINLRSRVDLSYDIRKTKIEPFFSVEHYLSLEGKKHGLTTQMRWTLGFDMPVNKWSDISVSYRVQQQLNNSNPLRAYIFILSYVVDLN